MTTSWFTDAGLGVFIHFGHASSRGWELSWQMTGGVVGQYPALEPVPCEEYFANAYTFDPQAFDADAWADAIAGSGARYAVIGAKHHDGFAMYDSAHSDYSIVKATPFGRDLLAEVLAALRARGLRIGIYLSMPDWHHPDYPRMTDATTTKPYRLDSWVRTDEQQWGRYREYFLDQLTELLSNYGAIDVLWLDGEFEHTEQEWDFADIRARVRALQPECLVNDRCVGHGDFITPEQQLPESAPEGPWEVCLTMNDTWGWSTVRQRWKSVPEVLTHLVEATTTGGNLLLNVGPRGDGSFPPEALRTLQAVGRWIDRNHEAVGGLSPAPSHISSRLPMASRTVHGITRVYVYCTLQPYQHLTVRGVPVQRVRAVRVLGDARGLPFTAVPRLPDVHAGAPDPRGELVVEIPSELAAQLIPVIAIDLEPEPAARPADIHTHPMDTHRAQPRFDQHDRRRYATAAPPGITDPDDSCREEPSLVPGTLS
ncbi:alpha-L-fucosidase [Microbacterium sp. LWH7-1.2]